MVAFGAGLTWAAAVVKWTAVTAPRGEETAAAADIERHEPVTVA
jgi:hypothetical protein